MPSESEIQTHVRQAAVKLRTALEACAANPGQEAVSAALDECLGELSRLELWGPANRLASSELWNIAGPLLSHGWMQNRAREKPRGYAGDYELLSRMYLDQSCDDPLGRLFDRYFLTEAAPLAVRHRMQMMADWIVSVAQQRFSPSPPGRGPGRGFSDSPSSTILKVALFGSAFGLEIKAALLRLTEAARQQIHIVLFDLDPAAIEFAKSQLAPLLPVGHLTGLATNLFRLPQRPAAAAALDSCDLLFCPGLFDYLEDEAARAMLHFLHSKLAPGGALTVFQFAPHCSTRALMEWIGNWYLLYRTSAQFRDLLTSAGFASTALTFGAEPLGVDLFATIRW
jgi:hypothetical protein